MQTDLWTYLKTVDKPILIYGMGNGADGVIKRLERDNVKVSGFFASDNFVRGQRFHSLPVLKYSEAQKIWKNFIVLTAFGTTDSSVIDNILNIKNEQELYIPDVPVYGNTVFDAHFYNDNIKEIKKIKSRLSDTRSKEVFEDIVNFKLSGNIERLFSSTDDENFSIKELIKLSDGARIFDLGAFDGDTALKFLNLYDNCGQIIAVEPSAKNYSRVVSINDNRVIGINCAISYLNGKMLFGNEGGRNQAIDSGDKQTETITIDTLTERFGAPDFIKFDIEGQELNGIIGGENTIKNHKPALMVSAYHRGDDLVSIPKKVLDLRNDYKVYIRRFPSIPCWDVYYFFI